MLTLETRFHVIIHHQANLETYTNEKSVKLHKHKYHMCFGMRSPVLTIVFTVHIHVLYLALSFSVFAWADISV
jgi:hypothetical protein